MEQLSNHFDFSALQVVSVIERRTDENWKMLTACNGKYAVLCAALSGEAEYRFYEGHQDRFQVREGDVMFFNRDCRRSATTSPEKPWHFISVIVDLMPMNEESASYMLNPPMKKFTASREVLELFQELNRVWAGKGPAYSMKCRSLVEEILYELFQGLSDPTQNSIHAETMGSIRNYIQNNYHRNISLEELAAMARCSTSHFRMLFKQTVGMTASQYLTMVRIEKAKDFLISGEMNVSEAAEAVGYRDIFYFSRQFKQVTGHPPSFFIP